MRIFLKVSDPFDLGELPGHVSPDPRHTHSHQVLDQQLGEHPGHQVQ